MFDLNTNTRDLNTNTRDLDTNTREMNINTRDLDTNTRDLSTNTRVLNKAMLDLGTMMCVPKLSFLAPNTRYRAAKRSKQVLFLKKQFLNIKKAT